MIEPVPAGTNLPTITFSFSPAKVSTFPLIESSVRTLVVSTKEAADITEGSAKGQIIIEDTAAYNASPTSGLIFYGKYTNAGGKAYFSSIFGGKENTNEDYDGFLAFATRKHGATTAERMRIDSEGKVGIGTPSPAQLLH